MTYRGCPTCPDVDALGRAPIGECGPDCVRRKRRLERLAAVREEQDRFATRWATDPVFRMMNGRSRMKEVLGLTGQER